MPGEFIADVETIREHARRHMENGAVTEAYLAEPGRTIELLNAALATELVCVLRYRHHHFMATGIHRDAAAREFKEHADNEQQHADLLAERIHQLGGVPQMNPASLTSRSYSRYVEGESLEEMIREDLVAERVVIEVYSEMIRYFGDRDITTRRLLESLLEDEEEHADDMSELLYLVNPSSGETQGRDPALVPKRAVEEAPPGARPEDRKSA